MQVVGSGCHFTATGKGTGNFNSSRTAQPRVRRRRLTQAGTGNPGATGTRHWQPDSKGPCSAVASARRALHSGWHWQGRRLAVNFKLNSESGF